MIFKNLTFIKEQPSIMCPDCSVFMTPYSCSEVIVDRCNKCKGIWFDKKEIGIFRDSLRELPLEDVVVGEIQNDTYTISKCPKCKIFLDDSKLGYNSKETVKKCRKCEGLWMQERHLLIFINQTKFSLEVEPEIHGILRETAKDYKSKKESEERQNHFKKLGLFSRPFMVIPLYDENPKEKTPWVTTVFILACVLMFFLTFNQNLFDQLGLIPAKFKFSGLITSIFVHASFLHIVGNMFYLWTFGDNVEDFLGPVKFILYFFFCGIVAGLVHMLSHPDSVIPAVGASGAISGLMGGYLYLFPHINLKTWVSGYILNIPIKFYLGFWIVGQVLNFLLSINNSYTNIAFGAHVGGFFAGYIAMWILKKY